MKAHKRHKETISLWNLYRGSFTATRVYDPALIRVAMPYDITTAYAPGMVFLYKKKCYQI